MEFFNRAKDFIVRNKIGIAFAAAAITVAAVGAECVMRAATKMPAAADGTWRMHVTGYDEDNYPEVAFVFLSDSVDIVMETDMKTDVTDDPTALFMVKTPHKRFLREAYSEHVAVRVMLYDDGNSFVKALDDFIFLREESGCIGAVVIPFVGQEKYLRCHEELYRYITAEKGFVRIIAATEDGGGFDVAVPTVHNSSYYGVGEGGSDE